MQNNVKVYESKIELTAFNSSNIAKGIVVCEMYEDFHDLYIKRIEVGEAGKAHNLEYSEIQDIFLKNILSATENYQNFSFDNKSIIFNLDEDEIDLLSVIKARNFKLRDYIDDFIVECEIHEQNEQDIDLSF